MSAVKVFGMFAWNFVHKRYSRFLIVINVSLGWLETFKTSLQKSNSLGDEFYKQSSHLYVSFPNLFDEYFRTNHKVSQV